MGAANLAETDREVVRVFENSDVPVLSAKEVSDKLGMTRQGANHRLKALREEGVVERKKIGSRAVAWWLAEN